MQVSDSALASLLLTDRVLERGIKPLSSTEYWAVLDAIPDPADLLGTDAAGLAAATGMSRDHVERIAALLDGATNLAFRLDQMQQSGLSALTPFSNDYPKQLIQRLRTAAPPVLYAVGPTSLLTADGIGIVGSRNMSAEADEVARKAAEVAVSAKFTVISGGARGVDRAAMLTAVGAGGSVVGVLADSLERAIREPETRHLIADERLCLVTPYKPSMGFTAGNAMGRNKLIYALSVRTLVVSSDLKTGGTWAGATEALRREFGDVMVWMGAGKGEGNQDIETAGATGISTLDSLAQAPPTRKPTPQQEQLTLDL